MFVYIKFIGAKITILYIGLHAIMGVARIWFRGGFIVF